MNSTAALPFELPSMPASSPGTATMFPVGSELVPSDESGAAITFDDMLQANAAPAASRDRKQHGPQPLSGATAQSETQRPSLIAPANFADQGPMPASLVPRGTLGIAPDDAGDTEASSEESGSERAVEGVVYEWVLASGLPQPPAQPTAVRPEPTGSTPKECLGKELGDCSSPTEAFLPTSPFGSVWVPQIAPNKSASVSTGPGIVSQKDAMGSRAASVAAANPRTAIAPGSSAQPIVLTREIVVGGRRLEASSLGEFQSLGTERGVARKIGQPEEGATLSSELFQPVTGADAAQALQLIFGDVQEVSLTAKLTPVPRPSLAKAGPKEEAISTDIQSRQVRVTAGRILSAPVDLVKVVENRLKAEGVETFGPLRIELVKIPTATEPGEFKVQAEESEVSFVGWWDKSGRMISPESGPGSAQTQVRSDGKFQPGTASPTGTPPPDSARSSGSGSPVLKTDSAAKQVISAPAGQKISSRPPTNSEGGISSARQAVAMRSTNDQEEFAGNAGNRVSAATGRTGDIVAKSRPQDLLTELAAMPFAERASRTEINAVYPASPPERIVQSDRIDKMDAVERLRSVINHEMAVLKASGADALAVVIRPTADSEVFIQLTREKGGVEAFIRVEKGDTAELRRQWSHLEGALAEQQVRLQPLQSGPSTNQDLDQQGRQNRFFQQQDGGPSGSKYSFEGQSRGGSRQEDQRRPQSPFETESASPRIPNPSTPRSAPRRGASTDRNFDNWA